MVKQRMGSADVAGECACLRKQLLGLRVANLYDLNPKVRHAWPEYAMHGPSRRVAARQSTGLSGIAEVCTSAIDQIAYCRIGCLRADVHAEAEQEWRGG